MISLLFVSTVFGLGRRRPMVNDFNLDDLFDKDRNARGSDCEKNDAGASQLQVTCKDFYFIMKEEGQKPCKFPHFKAGGNCECMCAAARGTSLDTGIKEVRGSAYDCNINEAARYPPHTCTWNGHCQGHRTCSRMGVCQGSSYCYGREILDGEDDASTRFSYFGYYRSKDHGARSQLPDDGAIVPSLRLTDDDCWDLYEDEEACKSKGCVYRLQGRYEEPYCDAPKGRGIREASARKPTEACGTVTINQFMDDDCTAEAKNPKITMTYNSPNACFYDGINEVSSKCEALTDMDGNPDYHIQFFHGQSCQQDMGLQASGVLGVCSSSESWHYIIEKGARGARGIENRLARWTKCSSDADCQFYESCMGSMCLPKGPLGR